jgi:Mg/Co/Ni transporter MgtE
MDPSKLALAQSFIESHVETAARELEMLNPAAVSALMLQLPLAQSRALVVEMLPAYAARLLALMPAAAAGEILETVSSNQLTTVLRLVAEPKRLELLQQLPERVAARCRRLLKHSEDSVGAWMSTDIVLLPASITVADALQRISEAGDLGDGDAMPLVNDDQKLIGLVSIRNLLRARSETPLSLLQRDVRPLALSAKMSLKAAEEIEAWQAYDTLIVLNQQDQPEGLLRHVTLRRGLSTYRHETVPASGAMLGDLGQAYLGSIAALFNLVVGEQQDRSSHSINQQKVPR